MHSNKRLRLVYLAGFLMSVHFALISYLNSSLLEKFVGDGALDILYVVGSVFGVIVLLLAPLIVRQYGSIAAFLIFIGLEAAAVFGLGVAKTAPFAIPLFILYLASSSVLYFCLDLNLEQETKAEGTTGLNRGILLTVSNLAWVLSPLAIVLLVKDSSFSGVYFLSSFILIPLFAMVLGLFKNTKKADASTSNIFAILSSLRKGGDKAMSIGVQFVLNFFFAWMTIYLPLLLFKEIGFGWGQIGLILTVMLLPFLIFELPAGILGDRKLGEKELLVFGFAVMFISTLAIPLLSAPAFWMWALVLFATRIGASIVEISNESYFFKHVKEDDTALISLFRIARPLSYILVPLLALPIVYFTSYSASFYFLAAFVLLGFYFIPKVDTR